MTKLILTAVVVFAVVFGLAHVAFGQTCLTNCGNQNSVGISSGTPGTTATYTSNGTISGAPGQINAGVQSGADIVAKINTALTKGTDILIPAGTYTLSSCAGWTSDAQAGDPWSPFFVGVKVPTGAHIHGAGEGQTVINVTRLNTDPSCALFANATRVGTGNNSKIELDHFTVNWTDQNAVGQDTIIEVAGADQFTMHDVQLTGNPNRLIIVTDSTRWILHDNFYALNTTSSVLGNTAISVNRLQSGIAYNLAAGKIYNEQLFEVGDPVNNGMSMVVITQSGVTFGPENYCNLINYTSVTNAAGNSGNCIETGADNLGNFADTLMIHGNYFYGGGAVRLPMVNSEFSNNYFFQGSGVVAGYAGNPDNTTTAGHFTINNNVFQCLGTGFLCGIFVQGNSPQGFQLVSVSENTVYDGGIGVAITGASTGGAPNCFVQNNRVYNTPLASMSPTPSGAVGALAAMGCSVVMGNIVSNAEADDFAAGGDSQEYGIVTGNSSSSVTTTYNDVSFNRVIDDQQSYSTGTVCTVSGPTSTTCQTSGTSRWLYSAGATWSQAWSNRYISISGTAYMIRGFFGAHYIEFENTVAFIGTGTSYSLNWTMNGGYYLGSPIINFTNNFGYVAHQYMLGYPSQGMITDVSGTVITNLVNNNFLSARQNVCSSTAVCKYPYYNQSPNVVGGISCTQANCASAATALYTMPNITTGSGGVSGILFRYDASVACTASGAAATAILQLGYTDVSGTAQTVTAGTATCTTLGASSAVSLSGTFMMYGNSAVTYKVTQATTPSFQARVMIYQETTN